MGCIWNIVRVPTQERPRNSDAGAPPASLSGEKFSAPRSTRNIIRSSLSWIDRSIHVELEPAPLLEFPDEDDRLVGRARAELGDDVDKRPLDVLGHPLGVAADVDVGAFGEPGPHLAADLAHAVLHIKLLLAVARPCERQSREQTRRLHRVEFFLVEEIAIAVLMAEEQPVLPLRAGGAAVEQ